MVTWNYSSLDFFFKGIRELKLRQIEVNIIFGWSRQNSDEMAISSVIIYFLRVRWNSPNIMFGWCEHLLMAISWFQIKTHQPR